MLAVAHMAYTNTERNHSHTLISHFLNIFFAEIAVDQVVFQKRLQQHLRKDPRYPSVSVQMQVFDFSCFSAIQYNAINHVELTNVISPCSVR